MCYNPCIPRGLNLILIMCIYCQFSNVGYIQNLYHLISESNITLQIRVMKARSLGRPMSKIKILTLTRLPSN
jgi:hypothetical protein